MIALIALRNLRRQTRRSLLALTTITGGVVAYLLAGGFIQWIFEDMRESTIHSQLGHLQITRPHYLQVGVSDPYKYLLPRSTDVVTDGGIPGIRTVSPRLSFSGLASKGEATVSFIGEGIDPRLEAPITRAIKIVAGTDLTAVAGNAVLLGEGLAGSLGAESGDTVVLLATTSKGGVNAVELRVAGIFSTITKAYDDTALRVPIDVARKLMRVDGATSWVVLLDRTSDTEATRVRLEKILPAGEFEVIPWSALADFYNKTVDLFSRQVGVVRWLIGLIVILSISNTMSMAVFERTGEIGTSLALGVRRRGILRVFLWEGAMLGLIGGATGLVLGILLAQSISAIGIPMPPPPGMAHGYVGRIVILAPLAMDALALAILTTLVASILPAWKASRMNIVDALRHQR